MQFVMYTGKLHIYQHSFFLLRTISKHAFPITILQNIMCKCAKSFSFCGLRPPDHLPGRCPWTPHGGLLDWPVFILGLSEKIPPPQKKIKKSPFKKFDEIEARTRGTNSWLDDTDKIVGPDLPAFTV